MPLRIGPPRDFTAAERERILARFERSDGCWLWTGSVNTVTGYGAFTYWRDGRVRMVGAHRAVYEVLVGPIADGMTLDHLCMTKRCVRPDHLEAVTHEENLRRSHEHYGPTGAAVSTGLCRRGHELTPDNVVVNATTGRRQCRTCRNASKREWYQQHKASA